MPEFYTWTILLTNQLCEIGEKQLSVSGSRGGQICPLMHVSLCFQDQLSLNAGQNIAAFCNIFDLHLPTICHLDLSFVYF